jgi:ribonuclease J
VRGGQFFRFFYSKAFVSKEKTEFFCWIQKISSFISVKQIFHMSEDKLSKWLSGNGLFGKNPEALNQNKAKPETRKQPIHKKDQKQVLTKTKGYPSRNSRGDSKNQTTRNNPLFDRPTVEKREKYHPTNYLPKIKAGEIRVVPLGGMEQVGENMMFLEWDDDIVVIDTGFLFPGPEHLGIDVLIPDITYLVKNKHKIRGIIYTHGHLDHIGGVPYIVPELGYPPMYATRLTKELIFAQCAEHEGVSKRIKVNDITPKSKIKLGKFEFEFFHINHSIPDGVAVVAKTPYGAIVHSSDFKFDYNPSDDQPIDLGRIAQVGKSGVALAMVDSTNALKKGQTQSESVIEDTLNQIVSRANGRVIVATFASNIGRISKLVESAEKDGRTVFLSGRSMERNIAIARKLNYLKCKDKTLQRMSLKADKMDPKKVLIISTGSQGEELAALTRMAAGTHRDIKLNKEDTIVFSSSPIPGNEMAIVSVLNNLAEIGCTQIDHRSLDIHVSGHAHAEECKLMTSLLNPKYIAPIHGEVFMRHGHRDMIVRDLQIKSENTFIMKNGRGVVLSPRGARLMNEKEGVAGHERLVQLGEPVQDVVVEQRQFLSENGIFIIAISTNAGRIKNIDLRTKGFVYMNQDHEIFAKVEQEVKQLWDRNYDPARPERALETTIQKSMEKFFLQRFRRDQLLEVLIQSS